MSKKKVVYLTSFFLPIGIMLVSWIINGFFPFGAKSLMAVDFNAQYIGLYAYLKHFFLNGDWNSFFYSFSKSIGGGMLGIWGFNLISPFNLLYFFFSEQNFQWAVMLTIGLRYGVMGLTWTHFFVKRYNGLEKNPAFLPIFGSLYALNGFNVSYQMNPIFYDGMIMLPLVLMGVEEVLDRTGAKRYVLLLALALLLHFYMGYMICIFVVIYALFYLFKSKDRTFKQGFLQLLQLGLYSILAVGLVAFIIVPILMSLVSTKGGLESKLLFEWKLQIDPLDIFSKLFLGAFDNSSWPAGPNLPNIYVGSLGIMGTIYYFFSSNIQKREKVASLGVLVIFILSCVHEFTSKLWHMGQNPAGFFYRFSWIMAFFFVYLAYLALREVDQLHWKPSIVIAGATLGIFAIVMSRQYSFLIVPQKIATMALIFVMLSILVWPQINKRWAFLAAVTAIELMMNATIVQSRVGYTDAYKYQDAVKQLQTAVAPIRPNDKEFYRIQGSFHLSKNDPFMADYPGMSVFSSNLENSTRDLFEQLGNTGINATTYYYGTPLSDAIFSLKYWMTPKPVYTKDYPDTSKMYVFGNYATRLDLTENTPVVYEEERTEVFQIPQTLPIAFGVNEKLASLELRMNQSIQNYNKITAAQLGEDVKYLEMLAANEITTDNFQVTDRTETYRRIDSSKPASITYHLTPQTDEEYWVTLPTRFSRTDTNLIRIFLNGEEYHFLNNYQATQFVNIASQSMDKPIEFKIEVNTDEDYSFSGVRLVKSNRSVSNRFIQERQSQALKLTHWDNSHIQGTVTITDDSSVMFTSIPYDKGWIVKVDGKVVETRKIWNSLLGFAITNGEHTIELSFIPEGWKIGVGISIVSFIVFLGLIYKKWV